MKIYHKFLLYQNKWIHPYTRIILGGVTYSLPGFYSVNYGSGI